MTPDFRKLFAGQVISQIGSRITREGLPITAVTMLGVAPLQMGFLVSLAGFSSWLGGPLGGYLADRFHRRPILIFCDLAAAAIIAAVPIAAVTGHLSVPLLMAVLVLAGLVGSAFDVATQTYVPSLVPGALLASANSRLALSMSIAEMTGPALAGLLIQTLTAPRAMAFDAVSFLFSALLILSIRRPEQALAERRAEAADAPSDAWSGLRTVVRQPVLRALVIRDASVFFCYGFFGALYMLFALRELKLQPAVLGVVIAAGGISNFLGASFALRIGKAIGAGHAMIAATVLSGAGLLFLPLATGPVSGAIFMTLQQSMDFCFPIYDIHAVTLRQSMADPKELGRVNAAMQTLGRGVWPVGAIIGGFLATTFGIRATLAAAAVGVMAAGVWLWVSPVRAIRDIPVREGV